MDALILMGQSLLSAAVTVATAAALPKISAKQVAKKVTKLSEEKEVSEDEVREIAEKVVKRNTILAIVADGVILTGTAVGAASLMDSSVDTTDTSDSTSSSEE